MSLALTSSLNSYSDEKIEALFNNVFDIAEDLGKTPYGNDGDFDALLAEDEGYGDWGVLANEDGSRSLWFLIDSGTLILNPDGSTEAIDLAVEDGWLQEKEEETYDWFYRIVSEFIVHDDLMEKLEDFSKEQEVDEDFDEDEEDDFE